MKQAIKIIAATPAHEWLGLLAFAVLICLGVLL
jgi:hypothetical protein